MSHAIRQRLENCITSCVAVGIVDRLEIIEIDICNRHLAAFAPRLVQAAIELAPEKRAIGQASERIVMRQMTDAAFIFSTLYGNAGKIGGDRHQLQFNRRRLAPCGRIKRERAKHARLSADDRRRPARAKTEQGTKLTIWLPKRVGLYVRDCHERTGPGRRAAGTTTWTDFDALDELHIGR
ncbi:hypothetical protein D3C73_663370 [compost metagenome]